MRAFALVLCACGAATPVSSTTTAIQLDPKEPPPADIADHLHAVSAHAEDPSTLYVEISSEGDHAGVLVQSATAGLGAFPDAVSVEEGGDVELHTEVATLASARDATDCKVKIFVLRLPQHDLLAIADGGAHATGTDMTDTCLATVGTAIVRQKLPVLLQRQLASKR
jgi:hypothetical protein